MNSVEKYVDKIINELAYSTIERNEFRIQFIDHISSLKDEYLEKGFSEDEAIKSAIKDFGNSDLITTDINNKVTKKCTILSIFSRLIFTIYCIFLILVLLNPMRDGQWVQTARNGGGWFGVTLNVIPFKTILNYFTIGNKINTDIIIQNLLVKIILFIPWGVLLPFSFRRLRTLKRTLLLTIIVILTIQVIRIIFPIGIADIDNIILYTLGSLFGFILYKFIIKVVKNIKFINQ
jgi:glycopeptide antibiotics resistance protein